MKLINYLFLFIFLIFTPSLSENPTEFLTWKDNFKKIALKNNISEKTFDTVMANIKFLPDVIKYVKDSKNKQISNDVDSEPKLLEQNLIL